LLAKLLKVPSKNRNAVTVFESGKSKGYKPLALLAAQRSTEALAFA